MRDKDLHFVFCCMRAHLIFYYLPHVTCCQLISHQLPAVYQSIHKCMSMTVCVCVSVCLFVCVSVCVNTYTFICMHISPVVCSLHFKELVACCMLHFVVCVLWLLLLSLLIKCATSGQCKYFTADVIFNKFY